MKQVEVLGVCVYRGNKYITVLIENVSGNNICYKMKKDHRWKPKRKESIGMLVKLTGHGKVLPVCNGQ